MPRCTMCRRIALTVAERGYNHHNDNYVGKCGYRRTSEGRRGKQKERERKRDEDETRFHRRPDASFDPSLIIVVSIELIATLALAFPFGPAVVRSSPLFHPSARSLFLPLHLSSLSFSLLSRAYRGFTGVTSLSFSFFEPSYELWKCNVGHYLSWLLEVRSLIARKRNAFFRKRMEQREKMEGGRSEKDGS